MLVNAIIAALPLLASTVGAAPSWQQPLTDLSARPGPPRSDDVIDLSKYTIGQILNYTLNHAHDGRRTAPLKKLSYVINRTESIKEYLNDPEISVTLFAPDDEALQFPRRRNGRPHHHEEDLSETEQMIRNHPFHALKKGEDDEDDDEERRRKIKKIVTAILHYHISPSKLSFSELQDMQTIPTTLNATKESDIPFRIRSSPKLEILPPPPNYQVLLNFYAKTREGPSILAKNGIIHLISAPLLPPLTPVGELFLFPGAFGTLTSAVQMTGLDKTIAPFLHDHDDDDDVTDNRLASLADADLDEPPTAVMSVLQELVEEAKALLPAADDEQSYKAFPFTIFAPTNRAFAKIPFKIRLFLFSPFGKRVLKKVLAYHIVPQHLFHTDYQLNATRDISLAPIAPQMTTVSDVPKWLVEASEALSLDDDSLTSAGGFSRKLFGRPGHVSVAKYELPTLLGSAKNESLAVNVYKYRIGFGKGPEVRRLSVGHVGQDEHDHVKVIVGDGVAWGGAVHVIGSIIRPPFAHRRHDHNDHDHVDEMASYFASLME